MENKNKLYTSKLNSNQDNQDLINDDSITYNYINNKFEENGNIKGNLNTIEKNELSEKNKIIPNITEKLNKIEEQFSNINEINKNLKNINNNNDAINYTTNDHIEMRKF